MRPRSVHRADAPAFLDVHCQIWARTDAPDSYSCFSLNKVLPLAQIDADYGPITELVPEGEDHRLARAVHFLVKEGKSPRPLDAKLPWRLRHELEVRLGSGEPSEIPIYEEALAILTGKD